MGLPEATARRDNTHASRTARPFERSSILNMYVSPRSHVRVRVPSAHRAGAQRQGTGLHHGLSQQQAIVLDGSHAFGQDTCATMVQSDLAHRPDRAGAEAPKPVPL